MTNGNIAYLAFTEKGRALAQTLCAALGGEVSCTRDGIRVRDWTSEQFPRAGALVFVGAAGIAVRAVAPHLVSKASDPAVVVIDECARFAIPLASGHLGGANELARQIARITGAAAAITTATDANGVFAVDEWARVQNCAVIDPHGIKNVSAKLLAGEIITVRSMFPIGGEPPEGVSLTDKEAADVWVDIHPRPGLTIAPRCLVLGVGCRRGTEREALEARFQEFCRLRGILPEAVFAAATIDLKQNEGGLSAFCEAHGWPLRFFSAGELAAAEGVFSASDFVAATTGVDNVCERSAVLASGEGGGLIVRKYAGDGMTFALAERAVKLDWRWQNG